MPLSIIALFALLATTAATDSATVAEPPSSHIDVAQPASRVDSCEEVEPALTPEQNANREAMSRYHHVVEQALRASTSPRDRAMSTQVTLFEIPYGESVPPRATLLRKAAQAAPNDVFVQWLWANASAEESGCNVPSACPTRLEAVARLQPDNGSAWLPVFNAASKANDSAAVEAALGHMAFATHFDDQYGEAIAAWMDVDRRYPMPKATVRDDNLASNDQSVAFVHSIAVAAATILPAYGPLIKACSRDKHPDGSPLRFRDCAQVGRIMLSHSTTLLSSRIGRAVLRLSGEATPQDLASARVATWQYEQWVKLLGEHDENAELKATMADWLKTKDETQVMQRRLQRAGIPLEPPAAWQPLGRSGKPISPLGEAPAPAKQP